MLDLPFATRDRTFGVPEAPEDALCPLIHNWRPNLVLLLAPVAPLTPWSRRFKRLMDIVLACAGMVVTAPLTLLIAIAIVVESAGPVLFWQRRIGLYGVPFLMLKFRTMRPHDDDPGSLRQATRHDPRVTRAGRWLRRYSVDELPQLLNVLKGEMSIVGPRPHAPGTRAGGRLFEDVTRRYTARHCVQPGITGLAQVRGWRGETDTEEKLLRRIDSDLEYIATWSAGLDIKIIWRTVLAVFHMRNAY